MIQILGVLCAKCGEESRVSNHFEEASEFVLESINGNLQLYFDCPFCEGYYRVPFTVKN